MSDERKGRLVEVEVPDVFRHDIVEVGGGGGLLHHLSHTTDGSKNLFANAGVTTTATSSDLLLTGTGYTTVNVGDVFSWSFDYKPSSVSSQVIKFQIDFGNGLVELGSVTATSSGTGTNGYHEDFMGTYTALAADASGGQLDVVLSVGGHTFTDNAVLSVEAIPEPSSMSLLALGGLALLRRRRA